MKQSLSKGITLMEIVIVLSLMVLVAAIVMPNLGRFRSRQVLKNTTEDIVSVLNKARTDTLLSLNSTTYGVHFESTRMVYFVGSSFVDGTSTNVVTTFDTTVLIPSSGGINLAGGGSNVIFTRLTGDTTAYGTIVVQLASSSASATTVTINQTGLVSSN